MPKTTTPSQVVNPTTETRFYPDQDRSFEVPTNLSPDEVASFPETIGKKPAPAPDTETVAN